MSKKALKKSKNIGKVLMTGNVAMAQGAIRAGCNFYAGYPITPQNELIAYMARHMREKRRVFVQAESEVAAINMVFGASASGARAMTSSSSPGVSLKQEGISYLAGAQLPALIINVMRGGPGLGNIASGQSDYYQATRGGGHGDYFTPTFSPWSVQEALELVMTGFDIADYYRNPVLILADAIIGQMMEPVYLNTKSYFTKRLPSKSWALTGARNRSPNVVKSFFLEEGFLEKHNEKLKLKWQNIKNNEQRSDSYRLKEASCLIIAYGSQARIVQEVVDILRQGGINAGLFRPVSLWPYPEKALLKAAENINTVVVVEQSLGQMVDDVRLALPGKKVEFLGRAGGGIPSVKEIAEFVKSKSKH
jgi:2-oxoglutarate/2-oxoacid ferredoxin oxidoreductase subunit alpha